MAEPFIIGIILKPYVSRYLINNFGDPVDLYCRKGRKLKKLMIECLMSKEKRFDKRIIQDENNETSLVISKDDFYRYGWEMTRSNMLKFNYAVEDEIKFICRLWIMNDKSHGVQLKKSIEDFQIQFGFTEEEFPYETIKKDYLRNGQNLEIYNHIKINNIRNLFMEQVSLIGT